MFNPNIVMKYFFYELIKMVTEWGYIFFNYKEIIINTLIIYSVIKSKYNKFYDNYLTKKIEKYKNNLYIKNIVYFTRLIQVSIYGLIFNVRVESISDYWLSISLLTQYEKRTILSNNISYLFNFGFNYNEYYHTNKDWTKIMFMNSFKITSINRPNILGVSECINEKNIKIKNEDLECLMILKLEDKFLVRVTNHTNDTNFVDSEIPSKIHFLSLEYRHPKMKKGISLIIDKKYFIEGNHLLSPTFVLRCLEYQKGIYNNSIFNIKTLKEYVFFEYLFNKLGIEEPYYFDMNYKLYIMDNHINLFELDSNEYIVIEKDGYVVKKNNS